MSERIHHRQPNQVYGQGMLKDGAGQFGCPSPSNNGLIFPEITSFTRSNGVIRGQKMSKVVMKLQTLWATCIKNPETRAFLILE